MICRWCSGHIIKGIIVFADGSEHVAERCQRCGRNPNPGEPYLKKFDGWESLPVIENNLSTSQPCAVRGCRNKGTQLHHFFPRHLFSYYDDAPTAYLCYFHHMQEWHRKLTPKMNKRKK